MFPLEAVLIRKGLKNMWHKEYRNYPNDTPLIKVEVEPNHGIIGCEMHELNGWGEAHHRPFRENKRGLISTLLELLFSWFHPKR